MAEQLKASVAIVVLNWNGGADTIECLESLWRIRYPRFSVYVVDNGSDDDSLDIVRAYARGECRVDSPFFEYDSTNKPITVEEVIVEEALSHPERTQPTPPRLGTPSFTVLRNNENLGFAAGNNVGIQFARDREHPDYVLLLNNDTVVDSNCLDELVRTAESDPSIGVVGAQILFYDKAGRRDLVQFSGGFIDFSRFPGYFSSTNQGGLDAFRENGYPCQWVSGTAMLIRARSTAFCTLDPSYFFGCEDADFCLRLATRGFATVLAPRAMVWHKVGASRSRRFSGFRLWLWVDEVKSTLLFLRRNSPAFVFRFPRYLVQAVTGRTRDAVTNLRKRHAVAHTTRTRNRDRT